MNETMEARATDLLMSVRERLNEPDRWSCQVPAPDDRESVFEVIQDLQPSPDVGSVARFYLSQSIISPAGWDARTSKGPPSPLEWHRGLSHESMLGWLNLAITKARAAAREA